MSQSDTRAGDIPVLAGEDLTGKNGRLVVLTHDGGVPEVKLPTANADLAFYLLVDDNADAELVAVRPFEAGRNVRAVLKGTCNPGDVMVLADTGTAADKGKVRALPAPVQRRAKAKLIGGEALKAIDPEFTNILHALGNI